MEQHDRPLQQITACAMESAGKSSGRVQLRDPLGRRTTSAAALRRSCRLMHGDVKQQYCRPVAPCISRHKHTTPCTRHILGLRANTDASRPGGISLCCGADTLTETCVCACVQSIGTEKLLQRQPQHTPRAAVSVQLPIYAARFFLRHRRWRTATACEVAISTLLHCYQHCQSGVYEAYDTLQVLPETRTSYVSGTR